MTSSARQMSNFGQWEVQIIDRPGWLNSRVFLWQRMGEEMLFLTKDGIAQKVARDGIVKEDELYFADMSPDQLNAFAEALSSRGVKTRSDSVAEGKLAATERHLEDMRRIALNKFPKDAS